MLSEETDAIRQPATALVTLDRRDLDTACQPVGPPIGGSRPFEAALRKGHQRRRHNSRPHKAGDEHGYDALLSMNGLESK